MPPLQAPRFNPLSGGEDSTLSPEDIEILKKYGYSYGNNQKLNDLQACIAKQTIHNNTADKMRDNRNTYGHTIVAGYDDDWDTEAVYMIRFKDFVDDIIEECINLCK